MAKLFIVACLLVVAASIRADEVAEGTAPTPTLKTWATEEHAGQAVRDNLLNDLFSNYRKDSYPENMTVKFGAALLDANLDKENNALNTVMWLRYLWTDRRLMWNKEEWGVEVLMVPSSNVWLPDITLFNSKDQVNRQEACWDTNALIYPNGEILRVTPCHLTAFCNLTLDKYPHGEQICTMKFGSWTFDGFAMGLDFYNNDTRFDVSDYAGSATYEITQNSAVKIEKTYDCCPLSPYNDLTWTLGLKKVDLSSDKACDAKH